MNKMEKFYEGISKNRNKQQRFIYLVEHLTTLDRDTIIARIQEMAKGEGLEISFEEFIGFLSERAKRIQKALSDDELKLVAGGTQNDEWEEEWKSIFRKEGLDW